MRPLDGQLAYPFRLDPRGLSRLTGPEEHVRELIEQVLFTSPGERLNRPEFGTPIKQLLFEGLSDTLAATTQTMVQGALLRWLDPLIAIQSVEVDVADSTLTISVCYTLRGDDQPRTEVFQREGVV